MSSTRNKRKRSENEAAANAPPSRRRSREQRADVSSVDEKKNEPGDTPGNGSNEADTMATQSLAKQTREELKSKVEAGMGTRKSMNKAQAPSINSGESEHKKADDDNTKTVEEAEETGNIGNSSSTDIDGDSGRNRALHLTEKSEGTEPEENDRVSRIQGMITHRTLLLERIRLCKKAAENRLQNQTKEGSESKSEAVRKELTDEDEVAKFREMTTQATQAAKRSRPESEAGEKRTSLSLRRGSSVGKRMNAALSSLAPGSNTNSSAEVASAQTVQSANALSSKVITKAQQGGSSLPKMGMPNVTLSNQMIKGPQHSTIQAPKPIKPSSQTGSFKQQISSSADPAQKVRYPSSKYTKSSNNRQSSASRPDPMVMPLHMGATVGGLPPNRLAQAKVHFPEAMALRERQSSLQTRLRILLEAKQQTMQKSVDLLSRSKRKNLPPIVTETQKAPKLPERRKTHWDALLQEMSWMAADFIEERKWKISAARTIASGIPSQSSSVGAAQASRKTDSAGDKNNLISHKMETNDDSKEPVGSKEKKKKRKSSRAKKAKEIISRTYTIPTEEDLKCSRNAGEILSAMVSELKNATIDSGAIGDTDKFCIDAFDRFQETRLQILSDKAEISGSNSSDGEEKAKSGDTSGEDEDQKIKQDENDEMECDDGSLDATSPEPLKELSFDFITQHINDLQAINEKSKGRSSAKDVANALVFGKVVLSSEQKEMLDFAEKVWGGKPSSKGVIISGRPVSGKTFATCCMLWKQRTKGPQVLVCPPTSVIRWRHEIARFSKLQVLTFGLSGGISTLESKEDEDTLEAGDVIVCEHSSVPRLFQFLKENGSSCRSFFVDCRHPESFFASLGMSSQKESNLKKNNVWNGPTELLSTKWWNLLIEITLRTEARLLLIEHHDEDTFSLSRSGLGEREQLEILALRAACIVGPHHFQSSKASIQRRIISWARHKGKSETANKVARVRKVLDLALSPVCFQIPESSKVQSNRVWDLRQCSMNIDQRSEYDKCCTEVRGALSSSLSDKENSGEPSFSSLDAVSNAFFRLRQECFLAETVRNCSRIKAAIGGEAVQRKIVDSPSQPDAMLALSLMNGSAKLRELVSILKFECGFKLRGEEVVEKLLNVRKCNLTNKSKKVVILAVLPEVQILVSLLLHALGVRHDLLHTTGIVDDNSTATRSNSNQAGAIAWSYYQTILSRFNDDDMDQSPCSPNILVATPNCLAGWNLGLGIETADIVITVDEDWTGRGNFVLSSVVAKIHAFKDFTKSQSSLVRLVCADSVEDKLFSGLESSSKKSIPDHPNWPCDDLGFLLLPESDSRATSLYEQTTKTFPHHDRQFPALKLMNFRDELLADVLLPSISLPPVFTSGSEVQFLPSSNNLGEKSQQGKGCKQTSAADETKVELSLIRNMLGLEAISSLTHFPLHQSLEHQPNFSQTEQRISLPPHPSTFPEEMMTRRDLKFLGTRVYFERLCKAPVWRKSSSRSTAIYLPRLPTTSRNGRFPSSRSAISGISMMNDNSELVDAWRKSRLFCKPEDLAAGVLFYRTSERNTLDDRKALFVSEVEGEGPGGLVDPASVTQPAGRFNAYAHLFSGHWDGNKIQDGNQGCEPLVYFPPLFHGSLEFYSMSKTDSGVSVSNESVLSTTEVESILPSDKTTIKRKDAPVTSPHNSKRMRFQDNPLPAVNSSTNGSVNMSAPLVVAKSGAGATLNAQGSNLRPNIPTEQSQTSQSGHDQTSLGQKATIEPPIAITKKNADATSATEFDEDYGLLGTGNIALPETASILASRTTTSVGCNISSSFRNGSELFSPALPCDLEETENTLTQSETNLDSVLLFVKKRPRPFFSESQGQPYRTIYGHAGGDNGWLGIRSLPGQRAHQGVGTTFSRANGEDSGKKAKKKSSQSSFQTIPSSFTRIAPASSKSIPNQVAMQIGKDGQRHLLHASFVSRQFETGLSMFESTSYRLASLRVETRVRKRLESLGWKNRLVQDAGPGLPLLGLHGSKSSVVPVVSRSLDDNSIGWTKIVKCLDTNGKTGDAAKLLSSRQRSALKGSLVAPSRVDFGPGGGYLAASSGMTGMSSPRSRVGVSLPMGVKVPQSVREQPLWTQDSDKALQALVLKYGMNWMLISRVIKGSEELISNEKCHDPISREVNHFTTSARQCRDRWQFLVRSETSLAEGIRESERLLRERSMSRGDKLPIDSSDPKKPSNFPCILLQKGSFFYNESEVASSPVETADSETSKKDDANAPNRILVRSFAALSTSKSKRHFVPITIPEVASGSQQNQPGKTHLSHMQSVQASVASQWASGRTEMWPLQILDFADKQRTTSRKSSDAAQTSSVSVRKQLKTSNLSSRPTPSHAPPIASRKFPAVPSNKLRAHPRHRQPIPATAPKRTQVPQRTPSTATKKSTSPKAKRFPKSEGMAKPK